MNIRTEFKDIVSSVAFKVINGETRIVGKFGQVSILDDELFDIWFIGRELESLTEHKMAAIQKKLPQELPFTRLTGEGYTQTRVKSKVVDLLPVLGVRKKRKLSDETKAKLTERLKSMRNR